MRAQNTRAPRPFRRWIPAVAVPIVIGVGVVVVPLTANAAVDLPQRSPSELMEFAAASTVDALSGTIEQHSELGLPDLTGIGGAMGGGMSGGPSSGQGSGGTPSGNADEDAGGAATSATDLDDLVSLATGTHTARVYLDGDNARLQVLDPLAERNVYVSPDGVWVYDSAEQAASHITVDRAALTALKAELGSAAEKDAAEEQAAEEQAAEIPTPEAVLEQALERLDASTEVSVGTDALVAGRAAYELVLTPRDADTLVGELRIAIDGETGVALAASVTARGADAPAFSVAFTAISFEAPDASVFAFVPPEGTAVTEHSVPVPTAAELQQWKAEHEAGQAGDADEAQRAPDAADAPQPIVHGSGWSAVVEMPLDAAKLDAAGLDAAGLDAAGLGPEASALLGALGESVDGGHLLSTALVTVLLTDDGRVLAGSVTPERLLAVAASER